SAAHLNIGGSDTASGARHDSHKMPLCSADRVEERLGLLEIGGVKTLGEAAVDRCQEAVSLRAFALLLPQACQGGGPARLQRPGLLTARHRQGLVKTRLCFCGV